ncbi:chaperone modulator CbpM [Plastoroseomonas arctica]|uniref:Chaperone modulatory protein CbpM n=1 Tax=Plastoroseomonas arctica TaxID=1509237 RepID=A0AAF1K468_9PROT|nr:chaperone modulator CbpM [Plastoroseomonas arctica]MBR0655914.1 hypothetical protein [Plastoroseomonas arctica]
MITIDLLCARFTPLAPEDVRRWVADGLLRPEEGEVFGEIDVERVRLIIDLRDTLDLGEDALPVVLGLLDQVYALRRQLRALTRED